ERLERWKVGEVEAVVKRPEFADRILLQLFKTDLVKMTWRNQGTLLEECLEDLLVLADDAIVQVGFVRPLQAPPWPGLSHHVPGREKNGIRVAVDMDELGCGEQLQQHLDAAGMGGGHGAPRTVELGRQ